MLFNTKIKVHSELITIINTNSFVIIIVNNY